MFARCFADVFSKYRQAMNDLGIDLVCNDRTSLLFMKHQGAATATVEST